MLNIQPADRVSTVGEYYLQQRMARVARMRAEGIDVVSLGIGGPDMPPPAAVVDTLVESARRPDTHSYQLGTGTPEMRTAMARWYADKYGVTLDPASQIMPLIGSKEGIMHISMTFLNPGDRVLVPNPGYPTYTSVTRIVGAVPVPYDLVGQNGWQPDFDALENLDTDHIKIMWVNYPHMPTGARAHLETFRRLVDFGRRHSILIVNDNPYSFILNDEPLSILQVPDAMDTAIEMNSLSKSHNMAGWRIGLIAANATFISWIRRIKSNVDSGQFRPMMDAAVCALGQDREWYDNLNSLYTERRAAAEKVMQALGCVFDPDQSGLFLWGRVPDTVGDVAAFAEDILESAHVFITPGFIFGTNGNRYIRISLCAPVTVLDEARRRISNYLKHHQV